MLSYKSISKDRNQFLSMTGLELELVDVLHKAYKKRWAACITVKTVSGEKRVRPHRKRSDGVLEETEDQLFFILHYLKSNSIQ
jgi:hypothetical protein